MTIATGIWTSRSVSISVCTVAFIPASQFLDDSSKLLLEDLNALLYYCIWFESADSLNVDVEWSRLSIQVQMFAFLWWILPVFVLTQRPALL